MANPLFPLDHDDTEPDNVRPGIIKEVADRQASKPMIGYREMGSNGLDQYEGGVGLSKEKVVIISIDPLHRTVSCEDFATGIEDKDDFKAAGAADSSGSSGKKVGDEISSYNNIHSNIIGRKHLGKYSFLAMSETADVSFYSNNGINGFILKRRGYRGWAPDVIIDTVKALDHIGMKVVISNVKAQLLKPKKVAAYLSEIFGVRIARGAKIFVVDAESGERIRVPTPEDLDTHEFKLDALKSSILITGNLKHVPKSRRSGDIDIYIKHVYVRTMHVPYLVSDWVNCDALEETISRDDYGENPEFDYRLEQYLLREGYERESEPVLKPMSGQKQIEELLGDIFARYQQEYGSSALLFGDLNLNGIDGLVNRKQPGETDWEFYKSNQKIVSGAGDPGGDELTTHGNKPEKRKGPTIKTPPKPPQPPGPGPGISTGGSQDAYVRKRVETEQLEGKIRPRLPMDKAGRGPEKPTLFIEKTQRGARFVVNLDRPACSIFLQSGGPKQLSIVTPLLVRAVVNYENAGSDLSMEAYEEKCDNMLNQMWAVIEQR